MLGELCNSTVPETAPPTLYPSLDCACPAHAVQRCHTALPINPNQLLEQLGFAPMEELLGNCTRLTVMQALLQPGPSHA
jgi:hypothetical protein